MANVKTGKRWREIIYETRFVYNKVDIIEKYETGLFVNVYVFRGVWLECQKSCFILETYPSRGEIIGSFHSKILYILMNFN